MENVDVIYDICIRTRYVFNVFVLCGCHYIDREKCSFMANGKSIYQK